MILIIYLSGLALNKCWAGWHSHLFHLPVEATLRHTLAIWAALGFDFSGPPDEMTVLRERQSKEPDVHQDWTGGEAREVFKGNSMGLFVPKFYWEANTTYTALSLICPGSLSLKVPN